VVRCIVHTGLAAAVAVSASGLCAGAGSAAAQDLKTIERELRRPSRDRVIRDRQDTKRTTVDWRQRARAFDRNLTDQARDERRDVRETTRRVRTELNDTARTQQRELDELGRTVERESRQQRIETQNVTRDQEQAAIQRISDRIRADNRTRNDERRERRRQVLERIRETLSDMRTSNQETAE